MSEQRVGKVRVIASANNWIEGNAVAQLRGTAGLPGVELAVGLPDLHPGKCGPVGAAFVTREMLYPHLIGNDVGCGMGLWASDLARKKPKLDRWEQKLVTLDCPWDGDTAKWLAAFQIDPSGQDKALGTIGGGNHFAELQQFETVENSERFKALGLDEDRLVVLVHSGSRALGQEIFQAHLLQHGHSGIPAESESGARYLAQHNYAVRWAQASRALIASRFLSALGSEAAPVFDLSHNFVARENISGGASWIHRKGANPSTRGALVIPGSRGSLSYLVAPRGESGAQDDNALSLSHGAGRKWNRTDCRARLRERFDEASLLRTDMGSRVICEDRDLLYEEAPQAYKKIEWVIADLVEAGLIDVVATLRPLITYKLRRVAP